jgi:hypothetical protein
MHDDSETNRDTATIGGDRDSENELIDSVFDLESVFQKREAPRYLIDPEVPERTVTVLGGESESGKTTLACAWGRDLIRRGHFVLLLDRDNNPRERITDRFERLGVTDDEDNLPLLFVWDCQQPEEPPLPNSPVVLDWVENAYRTTGKSPLVVVDSLVTNLTDEENENVSTDIRRAIRRCRQITRLGGTVVLIHHTGHNGRLRGSSDLRPAIDQGFIVTNYNPDGSHLLWKLTLTVEKTRYGLCESPVYVYAEGKMVRDDKATVQKSHPNFHVTLRDILKANPGITNSKIEALGKSVGIDRRKVRIWIDDGRKAGTVSIRKGDKNASLHTWVDL